jgi:hypothetical protein
MQEVAGSSPASSIEKGLEIQAFLMFGQMRSEAWPGKIGSCAHICPIAARGAGRST